MKRPTIVLVPGAWHVPACFDILRERLSKAGYESEAVRTPSIGAEPPTTVLSDDVAATKAVVSRLCDEGREVILLGHSYGGIVVSGASEGLGLAQRRKAGLPGGILAVIYLTAFVTPKGQSVEGMLERTYPPGMQFDGDYVRIDLDAARHAFYHDIPLDEQDKLIAILKHSSFGTWKEPCMYEPWHDMPCVYFACEDDQAMVLSKQETMAARLGGDIAPFYLKASHSPFVSVPDKMVEGFEYAIKSAREKMGET